MQKILPHVRVLPALIRPYWPHAAVLLLFCTLGWLHGFIQTSKQVTNPNLQDSWSLPVWAPYHAGPERAVFATTDMWDGAKKTTAKSSAQPQQSWQFVGTVRTGKTYAAVILAGSNAVKRMVPGDVLPNGEKILAVKNGLLRIDAAGVEQELKLFQQAKK